MSERRIVNDYPRRLPASQKQEGEAFELQADHYAGCTARKRAPFCCDALFELAGNDLGSPRQGPRRSGREAAHRPRLSAPRRACCGAHGLLFLRFAEGTRPPSTARRSGSGYEVSTIPGYAPHAAWVRANDGDIASSLRDIDALSSAPLESRTSSRRC